MLRVSFSSLGRIRAMLVVIGNELDLLELQDKSREDLPSCYVL